MAQPTNNARARLIINDYMGSHPETLEPMPGAKYCGQAMFTQKNNGKIMLMFRDNIWANNKPSQPREVEMNRDERAAIWKNIRDAISDPNFSSIQWPLNQRQWIKENGRNILSPEPMTVCYFTVNKNANGLISLGYSKGDYQMEVFFRLKGVDAFKRKLISGEVIKDTAAPSHASALGWCTYMETYLNKLEQDNYRAPEPKNNAGGGNNNWNGGNNNNNSGSGGGSNAGGGPTDFDEDFDF